MLTDLATAKKKLYTEMRRARLLPMSREDRLKLGNALATASSIIACEQDRQDRVEDATARAAWKQEEITFDFVANEIDSLKSQKIRIRLEDDGRPMVDLFDDAEEKAMGVAAKRFADFDLLEA